MSAFPYRQVAKTLLVEAEKNDVSVTNLTIQKLLYFAHALRLAAYDRPLVDISFQAWKYGPVLAPLYHDLKVFGPGKLSPNDLVIDQWDALDDASASEAIGVIRSILGSMGKLNAGQLIEISHGSKGPWHTVFASDIPNIVIPDNEIQSYFKTQLK